MILLYLLLAIFIKKSIARRGLFHLKQQNHKETDGSGDVVRFFFFGGCMFFGGIQANPDELPEPFRIRFVRE